MERKRQKSDDTEDKRICMSPSSMFRTPVSDQKEQEPLRFEQWGVNEVVSFISSNRFGKYAAIFQGTSMMFSH